ncbi:hypothetical protein HY642_04885 [Candidatus Woesearchaeota archaeon]|nr:hypothetical protein [Candidatus Woesearchaeota archaeon]
MTDETQNPVSNTRITTLPYEAAPDVYEMRGDGPMQGVRFRDAYGPATLPQAVRQASECLYSQRPGGLIMAERVLHTLHATAEETIGKGGILQSLLEHIALLVERGKPWKHEMLGEELNDSRSHYDGRHSHWSYERGCAMTREEYISKDLDYVFRSNHTRTAAVYFESNGKPMVAFDDIPDPAQNIILARAKEAYMLNFSAEWDGFQTPQQQNEWVLPITDEHVAGILRRAERDRRILELSLRGITFDAGPGRDNLPPFGTSALGRALLGGYAQEFSNAIEQTDGLLGLLYGPPSYLCSDTNKVVVRPVRLLGFGTLDDMAGFSYAEPLGSFAYSRGVTGAKEFREYMR